MYLLDTHTFLWALYEPLKISAPVTDILLSDENQLFLSAASLWEISILKSLHRIETQETISEIFEIAEKDLNLQLLPIEPKALNYLASLPFHHRDPFDRLMIAQSISSAFIFLSKDELLDAYPVKRVW